MPTTPTQRTLSRCRADGLIAAVAEYWQSIPKYPGGGVRKDLFGFVDIVVLGECFTGIQATSGSNGSARVEKICTERNDEATAWIRAGGKIEVWAWRKLKRRVDNRHWHPRITEVTLTMLEAAKAASDL